MSDQPQGPTAGQLLRRAREATGLHVAALAVSLKVPVRKLEALEEDRYDLLTDAVFTRALASSVCRTLKVDPQPVLDLLPQGSTPRLVPDHYGLNAPFRGPGDAAAPGWRESLTRPVPLVAGGLLVGALVLLLMPDQHRGDAVAPATQESVPAGVSTVVSPVLAPAAAPVPMGAVTIPVAEPAPAPQPPAAQAPSVQVPALPAVAPLPSASARAAGAGALPSTVSTASAAPTQPAAPSAAGGLVVFKASGPSWVEVTDSKGTVALRRLLAAGETAGASGVAPLTVTIGSASSTAVEVRGKRYDLAPVSRDNVARFEVK